MQPAQAPSSPKWAALLLAAAGMEQTGAADAWQRSGCLPQLGGSLAVPAQRAGCKSGQPGVARRAAANRLGLRIVLTKRRSSRQAMRPLLRVLHSCNQRVDAPQLASPDSPLADCSQAWAAAIRAPQTALQNVLRVLTRSQAALMLAQVQALLTHPGGAALHAAAGAGAGAHGNGNGGQGGCSRGAALPAARAGLLASLPIEDACQLASVRSFLAQF